MNRPCLYIVLSVFTLLLASFRLSAQTHNVSGVVKDAETKQAIAFSSIEIISTGVGTTTDALGKFRIYVPQNIPRKKLVISSLGYITDTVELLPAKSDYLILLKPSQGILNEVVVTGVTKATLIRENPIPVISVSSEMINHSNESNIIDVMVKSVPGLNAVKTGPNISKPFIRGLGYNRVLTLFDGVRQEGQQWGDEHGLEVDAYNIVKGEVIKGPASLMYGSDAVAGVVSLIPAMPDKTDSKIHSRYLSEYQDNNGLIGNGAAISYANSHWAYILRGSYRMAKNYANHIDGRVYNTGFREANASASVKYTGHRGYSVLSLTFYNNLQGIPDGSRDSLKRKFTKQIDEGSEDDIKNRPVVTDAVLDSYRLSPLHQHIQHYRIYTKNHYKLGNGDMDILLAFQQNIRREYNHPTLARQAGMFVRLNTFNYGLSYNLPAILNTEITGGINGMYQNNKNKDATDFPIPDYRLFDAGGFVYAKWKQGRWTISGGIRYDTRSLNANNFYTKINSATGFSKRVSLPDTAGAYLQFAAFNKRFNGMSLSFGATFRLSGRINLKANIARGYRAPGITELASNGLDPGAHIVYLGNRNFVPEFSLQEDAGAEYRDKIISLSVSLFNNNIRQYIYLTQLTDASGNLVINDQGNKTYQYQQASAQLYGLEAMLNVHPSMISGFSFDNAFSMVFGFNRKEDFKNKSTEGEYLPLIPPAKLLSSINQSLPIKSKIFSSVSLKAEMDFNDTQNRFLALNNTETQTPAYTLFNFSIITQIKYIKENALEVQLQVNNAFDKAYQSGLSRLKYFEYYVRSPNRHLGIYGMGRNICLKVIVSL